jgi:hypothetical protein
MHDPQILNVHHGHEKKKNRECQARDDFNEEVSLQEFAAADATAAATPPVVYQRQHIHQVDALQAMAATRRGPEDAFFEGQPIDANVEEATDEAPQQEDHDEQNDDHESVRFQRINEPPT